MTSKKFPDNLSFTLVGPETYDEQEEFRSFINYLKTNCAISATPIDVDTVRLSLLDKYTLFLSVAKAGDASEGSRKRKLTLELSATPDDFKLFNLLRYKTYRTNHSFTFYSKQFGGLLPTLPHFNPLLFRDLITQTEIEILRDEGLTIKFVTHEKDAMYAANDDGEFFIVNLDLLKYIIRLTPPHFERSELFYKVAPNLDRFSCLADSGLLPNDFYEFYGKNSRIINRSRMDLHNPGRKVFIKPYIHEINDPNSDPYHHMDKSLGREFLRMDKIRKGETLETALTRFVSKELDIADDFIGAIVSPNVEFDLDRDGIATPRVIVKIFVENIRRKEWLSQTLKTGWNSVGQEFPKINVRSRPKKDKEE